MSPSVSSLNKEQQRVINSFIQRADTSVRQPLSSESFLNPSPFSPSVPKLIPTSTQTAAVTLGHFLRGVNHIGDKPALHALPALLDCDIARPHQGEDVSSQLGEGVLHIDGVTCRCLDVAHPVRPCQLLCFLAGHLEDKMR